MRKINNIRVFDKGECVYALINSTSAPNNLIMCRVKIIDIDHDELNPSYTVQILKFYDSFSYIKKHFIGHNLKYARRSSKNDNKVIPRISPNKLRQYSNITSLDDMYKILSGEAETYISLSDKIGTDEFREYKERHYICVDAIFCYRTKMDAVSALNTITDFEIFRVLRYLKTLTVKSSYSGMFKKASDLEFFTKIRNFIDNEGTDANFKKIKNKI
jgi:hypothetical protein